MKGIMSQDPPAPMGENPRILLLLEASETVELFTRWLGKGWDLAVPEDGAWGLPAFDLAMVDVANLDRRGGELRARKESSSPVFLPVLLIASPGDAIFSRGHFPESVDEIILVPFQKFEVRTRVANLLERRRLSEAIESRQYLENRVAECPAALLRAHEELSLKANLLDFATDAIYVTDLEGNFIYANEAACLIRGHHRDELMRLNLQQLIAPDFLKGRPQRLETLQAQGELIFETAGLRKDGPVLPLEVHARVLDLQGHKVILSVARDITERKRTEEINARMEGQLRQGQKLEALGTFAGGIAHEFNNVLGAVKGYIELAGMTLETVPGADRIKNKLEGALRGADRARDLVKQLLAFTRQTEQEAGPLEILPVVKEALKLLRASIPRTIEIHQNLDPQCGLVLADPVQINQILMNLSSNAYHAMRELGGVLGIGLEPLTVEGASAENDVGLKAGSYVRLTVRDTGHGMDRQTLEHIFDPFFTTKAVGEGTGLGLSAVHGIVQSLGGAIRASSELGVGSAFHVYLPSYEVPPVLEAPKEGTAPGGTEHILLVDDEAAIVQIGKEFLESLGYRVTASTSSSRAWGEFRARPENFDLVITDLTMPAMTGIELAEAVLALREDIPVILTTGYSESMTDKAQKLGIRQCLMKPLVLRHLAWAVRRELDKPA